jgi:hypothetical protein
VASVLYPDSLQTSRLVTSVLAAAQMKSTCLAGVNQSYQEP